MHEETFLSKNLILREIEGIIKDIKFSFNKLGDKIVVLEKCKVLL